MKIKYGRMSQKCSSGFWFCCCTNSEDKHVKMVKEVCDTTDTQTQTDTDRRSGLYVHIDVVCVAL